jgi:hypothetical protein
MKDGEDHINIYSKGETELGKYLSNFAYVPFKHPYDGEFKSVEGYWYYNLTNYDYLKELYGFKAKQVGREYLEIINPEGDEWQVNETHIKIAILCKLTQGEPKMLKEFIQSELPFRHYYKYGDKIVEPKEGKWIVKFFEDLRKSLKD